MATREAIRTAQEWLATVKSVPPGNPEIQAIIDTIDEALELAMEQILSAGVTSASSVQCPHCKWGFDPSVIDQHIREKHS